MTSRRLSRAVVAMWTFIICSCVAAHAQHLSFDPPVSVPTAIEFQVRIHLAPAGATVQGLDLVFTYEPSIVSLDAVEAGDWFTDSGADHYLWIDPVTPAGAVHVSAALLGFGSAVDGHILTLSFTALAPGVSPLHFLAIDLRNDANAPLLFTTHSTGDEIVIEEAIGNESSSMGAFKSLWR